ncbi:hypothetical protein GZH47_09395 [Paenibacillus rhizovicinus]|uniref:DUF5666 domain-containing protein n=1 Tax=Paenibacillus rhizovicinus TaxID=2704463 RepID=A0A6C0NXW9_9BACL|nr:hypothetical protein [Paenibacillus rhizovicinus]QHW31049.1 hypothetical protein GZH47_09395 [Paenibacillus rhizovicinus]
MERSSIKMMAAAMLISVLLAGCGDKNDAQSANSGQAASVNGQPTAQDAGSGNGTQQPDRTADYFAKVVKVSGDSIIVQKSTMSPADMPSFGGGRQGGRRPQGGQGQGAGNGQQGEGANGGAATNGTAANGGAGAQAPVQGQAQGGQGANGQAGGQGGNRQGGRFGGGGGFMNQMKFADEQVTVPVNADTEIVKMGRGQNGMTTDTLKATDLKEGDVLMVWLGSDNTTAKYIRLQFNPADMSNGGKAGNGQ